MIFAMFYKFYDKAFGIGPHEPNNIYGEPENKKIIARLKKKMVSLKKDYEVK